MSEQEAKKYYVYFYTWNMAEAMRKQHARNGRVVCDSPMLSRAMSLKKWAIWYNRQRDTHNIPTGNARYYDK
ncbi:hypothetical protein KAR91_31045 [Candidatus Pacearchaeota archaeon]|nr:hypothetical protein [Candidatus Pacearchaeota archaeon]